MLLVAPREPSSRGDIKPAVAGAPPGATGRRRPRPAIWSKDSHRTWYYPRGQVRRRGITTPNSRRKPRRALRRAVRVTSQAERRRWSVESGERAGRGRYGVRSAAQCLARQIIRGKECDGVVGRQAPPAYNPRALGISFSRRNGCRSVPPDSYDRAPLNLNGTIEQALAKPLTAKPGIVAEPFGKSIKDTEAEMRIRLARR